MAHESLFEFTDSNFKEDAVESETPVIVDMWAPWCGPCQKLTPIIEELAGKYSGRIKVGAMNLDENTQIAAQYGVQSIPTILFIRGGEVVDKHVGLLPKELLKEKFDKLIV